MRLTAFFRYFPVSCPGTWDLNILGIDSNGPVRRLFINMNDEALLIVRALAVLGEVQDTPGRQAIITRSIGLQDVAGDPNSSPVIYDVRNELQTRQSSRSEARDISIN